MLNSEAGDSDWCGVSRFRLSLAFPALAAAVGIALLGCSPGPDSDASGQRAASEPGAAEILGVMVARFVNDREASRRAAEPGNEPTFENREGQSPPAPNPLRASATRAPRYQPTPEADGGSCEVAYRGLVTIIPVRDRAALRRATAGQGSAKLVYSTGDTAIFDDGRVLTARVENVGDHLSAVGWAENPMRILGATSNAGATPANYAWRSGSGSSSKRTRRRG